MTTESPDNPPAFPTSGYYGDMGNFARPIAGMTLRDWFAGQALAGLLGSTRHIKGEKYEGKTIAEALADQCYLAADEMLKRRKS